MLYQEKSGNPELKWSGSRIFFSRPWLEQKFSRK
jgi:hypothetical protein